MFSRLEIDESASNKLPLIVSACTLTTRFEQFPGREPTMKRTFLAVILVVLVAALMAPAAAQATTWHYWHHVGGDPLHANVNTAGEFSYLMLNSSKYATAQKLVAKADGLPSWVMKSAKSELQDGDIHSSTIGIGTKVGAMSYGRKVVRVMKNTIYHGQYKHLSYYYVNASKTTTVTIDGKTYRKTVTYRVSMAKKCGNVFVFHKTTKLKLVPPSPTHDLAVLAGGEYSCLIPEKVNAVLIATPSGHSDGDAVTYTWNVNGTNYTTTESRFPLDLQYEVWYNITLTAKDTAGHQATATLAPRFFESPGTPPQ